MADLSVKIPHKDIEFSTSGGSTYTLRDEEADYDSQNSLGGTVAGAMLWVAGYSGTYTIKRVGYCGYRSDVATSDTISAEIWSNGTGPGTKLGESSSTDKTAIPASPGYDWFYFDFSTGVEVTAGTTYWLVLKQSGTTSTIYWFYDADGNGVTDSTFYYSDNGTTWTVLYGYQRNYFRVYTLD